MHFTNCPLRISVFPMKRGAFVTRQQLNRKGITLSGLTPFQGGFSWLMSGAPLNFFKAWAYFRVSIGFAAPNPPIFLRHTLDRSNRRRSLKETNNRQFRTSRKHFGVFGGICGRKNGEGAEEHRTRDSLWK